jgi:hypothetical protein
VVYFDCQILNPTTVFWLSDTQSHNGYNALHPYSYFQVQRCCSDKDQVILLIILQDKYPCLRARVYRTLDDHPYLQCEVIDKHGRPHDLCFVFKNHRDLPVNGADQESCKPHSLSKLIRGVMTGWLPAASSGINPGGDESNDRALHE